MELALGLGIGTLFGAILQRCEIIRYDRQIGLLLLYDMTLIKFLLSAVCVGMVGIYFLRELELVRLAVKPTILGANILGGLIFGLGWGLLGYGPATGLGALGEGRWDALWGILGGLFGTALYAEVHPFLERNILAWGNIGPVTIPQELGTIPWVIITLFVLACVYFFRWLERYDL